MLAEISMKKFLGHMCYLSEELTVFAFFDDGNSGDTKKLMVNVLHKQGPEHPLKRITIDTSCFKESG